MKTMSVGQMSDGNGDKSNVIEVIMPDVQGKQLFKILKVDRRSKS